MRALLLLLAVTSAQAQEDQARAHFAAGVHYYDDAHYADALKEFEEAYRLSKRVGFLYNLGACHERLGHDDQALVLVDFAATRAAAGTMRSGCWWALASE